MRHIQWKLFNYFPESQVRFQICVQPFIGREHAADIHCLMSWHLVLQIDVNLRPQHSQSRIIRYRHATISTPINMLLPFHTMNMNTLECWILCYYEYETLIKLLSCNINTGKCKSRGCVVCTRYAKNLSSVYNFCHILFGKQTDKLVSWVNCCK